MKMVCFKSVQHRKSSLREKIIATQVYLRNKKSESEVAQSCPTLCDPWTVAHQAPPSMGFSRQEYWSALPFPSPGDLPDAGIEPRFPTLHINTLTSAPPGKPLNTRLQVLTSKISREERKPGWKKREEEGEEGWKGWPYRRLLSPTDAQALWDFSLGLQRREDWNSALPELDQTRTRIRVLCQEEVISLQFSAQAEDPSTRFLCPGLGD